MTIPRTRRYPRQPITKALSFGDWREWYVPAPTAGNIGRLVSWGPTTFAGAPGSSWTTNLTPTRPPLAAPETLDWRRASEWAQRAGEAPEAVQLTGYIRKWSLDSEPHPVVDSNGWVSYVAGPQALSFDFQTSGEFQPVDLDVVSGKVNITITEAE